MGKHGTGIMNGNGEKLIDFCEMYNLIITGTIIKTPGHPLVNQQFRRSILDTRVMPGADVTSDHHLVRTRVRLALKKITKPTSSRITYDADKLRHEAIRQEFTLELRNQFAVLETTDDDHNINS